MAEKIQIDGNSPEYEAFVAKFKSLHTSDDTFTPPNVYAVVRDWCTARYGLADAPIVRPFWPGADYTLADYKVGCAVIDNPPFSIITKICAWYNAHGVRFFLFAPGLTSLSIARDGKTAFISAGLTLTFLNGAKVRVSFVTNMEPPDVLATTASDLLDALEDAERENRKVGKRHVEKLQLPDELVTAARMEYLAIHHQPYTVKRCDAHFVRRLECYPKGIFGGGFLLSPRAAAERAAAERAAAERAAAVKAELSPRERAAAERAAAAVKVELSPRERMLVMRVSSASHDQPDGNQDGR